MTERGGQAVSAQDGTDRWSSLLVLLAGQFMANVDSAIANLAAPSIRQGLDASDGQVALVVSGYLVAYAVLLITGARLGATYGYRRLFLLGLVVFTAASLACGLAPGVIPLVVARIVQGAGAALLVPQVLSGIQLSFTGQGRARALGYYAIALSGGAVAGQVLGGLLISADLFGAAWRPIFLINVPLGAVLFVMAWRKLPHEDGHEPRGMDLRGVGVLSAAVLLVVTPLVLGHEQGWPSWTWYCLAASVPAFLWFALTQRAVAARGGRPLLAPAVLGHLVVRRGLIAHGLTTMTYFALLFVLALYLQQGLGAGPAYSGFAMVAWVGAFGLAGPLLPKVPERHRPLIPVVGCLVLAAGYASVCVALLTAGWAGALAFPLLGVGGLGLGISSNSLIGMMTAALPSGYAADLAGVINTNGQLSGAFGVAVASTGYLGLQTGEGMDATGAFTVVLVGFTVLALASAVVAQRATAAKP